MGWRCFLIEPTERCYRALRRYARHGAGWDCAGGYHHAQVRIEDGPLLEDERGSYRTEPMDWPRDDPHWPTHCACGYAFAADDEWQLFYERIYRAPDGGEYLLRAEGLDGIAGAPPGAMWEAPWLADAWQGPDGKCLVVMLPGNAGEWVIDGPSSSGGRWERSGTPPEITASPSINAPGRYHGFLQAGVLTDDVEGRKP